MNIKILNRGKQFKKRQKKDRRKNVERERTKMLAMRVLHFDYRVVGCVAAWEAILFYFILFYLRLSPLLCISFSLNLFLSPSLSSPSGKRFCRCVCVGVCHACMKCFCL